MKTTELDRWLTRGYDWQAEGDKQFFQEMPMCSCDESGTSRCEVHGGDK